jgi:tRNA threonylcarbamoyladenosine biosynthesis protein TsaE
VNDPAEGVWTYLSDEPATRRFAGGLAVRWTAGDVVLLSGPLGSGKTTFVRGVLEALGHAGPVRSPTFNLVQTFETVPPVLHADLYRLDSAAGIGLEEAEAYLCLIEWPDRPGLPFDELAAWRVAIDFQGNGRRVRIRAPGEP